MLSLMMSMMITMSSILIMLNHPLSMGLMLIMQTLITAMMVGFIMKSFLFAYIIIIIMLSGALVLFIYMASIASNEKFNFSFNMMIYSTLIIISMTFCFYIFFKHYYVNNIMMSEEISLIKVFNMTTSKITLMMIIYLLITMIVVSNIASVNEGPLRMKTNYE